MLDILQLIGRDQALFDADLARHAALLAERVATGRFLVIGGAGSIGQAVVREIFKRQPRVLHVVDISENNMVELVRDIRSTLGYIAGDFRTFAIDCGSVEFTALLRWAGGYDYVLNLSALKHVRSEKDPFTLMRMVEVNVLNTIATLEGVAHPPLPRPLPHAGGGEVSPPLPSPPPRGGRGQEGARKYFCVSTDKAANPANMMGASKRIMEQFLMRASLDLPISTARFANVAFSDGSLLHGFNQRFAKRQPFSAPNDVRRYFVTPQESGELCLLSCLLGENRDIFFPKLSEKLHLITFAEIARRYLRAQGYEPYECASEDEARARVTELLARRQWPCYFFASDTTGEKDFEEFFTERETLDLDRFASIGVIKNEAVFEPDKLAFFVDRIAALKAQGLWTRDELVELFHALIPEFGHKEMGKFLDDKM
jgi:FlaA1/EpsC-like NDP-sugar epimerase